jgi:hypothetical protein
LATTTVDLRTDPKLTLVLDRQTRLLEGMESAFDRALLRDSDFDDTAQAARRAQQYARFKRQQALSRPRHHARAAARPRPPPAGPSGTLSAHSGVWISRESKADEAQRRAYEQWQARVPLRAEVDATLIRRTSGIAGPSPATFTWWTPSAGPWAFPTRPSSPAGTLVDDGSVAASFGASAQSQASSAPPPVSITFSRRIYNPVRGL